MKEFSTVNFSIVLPKNWHAEEDEGCYLFFSNEGYGALQISEYTKNAAIANEDILDLVDFSSEELQNLAEEKYGDFDGFELTYSEDKKFWRKLWLKKDKLLLFVTYNSGIDDRMHEVDGVNEILSSLKQLILS